MTAKQYRVKVVVSLLVTVDEDKTNINDVLQEMDFDFEATTDDAEVVDNDIEDWEILDSRDDTIKI